MGLGLRGVFEIVRETREHYPELCVKAMKALLDMLQGQQPESMKWEPTDIIGNTDTQLPTTHSILSISPASSLI